VAVAALPPRQGEVLALVARGATNKEIAAALGISSQTVKGHLTCLMQSLGVQSRAALACLYYGGEPFVPTVRVAGDRYRHHR
jgi:DNA-binding NarL/FixJ family response regulator